MQAWASPSRFTRRMTDPAPTKSGVVGLLAAARGFRRTDPLEELLSLRFGVRVDQPGRVERDFQTARAADGHRSYPLTYRFYLTDAVFIAAVEGEDNLVAALDNAVRHPTFPLYLGRRSCSPVGPLTLGVRDTHLWTALADEPWQASRWYRRRSHSSNVCVEMRADADAVPDEVSGVTLTTQQDVPIDFNPAFRKYGLRSVAQTMISIPNPDIHSVDTQDHDPMAALGGA